MPIDDADAGAVLVREQRILVALLGPQHLLDRILERPHPRLDRRAPLEAADRVVLKERRGGPDADERRRPDVAAAAGRQRVVDSAPVTGCLTLIVPTDGSCLYDSDEKLSQMLSRMALVASGLQALIPSSVTGTRSSVER